MSFLSQPITFFGSGKRYLDDLELQVVISENTNDTLTITKQPVQQGASITDHSFMEPTTLTMSLYFTDSLTDSLTSIYQDLLDLQSDRTPFTVVTLKRTYTNMLVAVLANTTDKYTENCLKIDITLQEVLIVSLSTSIVPKSKQKFPGTTAATQNVGKKSALLSGVQSVAPGTGAAQ